MPTEPPPPPVGRIDIHSHLLPGIDDGCASLDESIECIRMLRVAGYVGTVCTPHIWPRHLPDNTPTLIKQRVDDLRREVAAKGIEYAIWPGGELQLFEGAIDWMQAHGVPTLAGSRCVLTDYWGDDWPDWAPGIYRWLIDRRYQPILAHPERMPIAGDASFDKVLRELESMGVWLQGNFQCMTGEEGYTPDMLVRAWLTDNRYRFMALDMHGPDTLGGRLDGLLLVETEFGRDKLESFVTNAPRRDLFGIN